MQSQPALPAAAPDFAPLARQVATLRQRVEQDLGQMRAELESVGFRAGEPAALLAHAGAAFAGLIRDVEPAASIGALAQRVVCWEPQVVSAYLCDAWHVDVDRAPSLQDSWRDAGLTRVDRNEAVTCRVSLGGGQAELVCVTPETYERFRLPAPAAVAGVWDDEQELSRAYEA